MDENSLVDQSSCQDEVNSTMFSSSLGIQQDLSKLWKASGRPVHHKKELQVIKLTDRGASRSYF